MKNVTIHGRPQGVGLFARVLRTLMRSESKNGVYAHETERGEKSQEAIELLKSRLGGDSEVGMHASIWHLMGIGAQIGMDSYGIIRIVIVIE